MKRIFCISIVVCALQGLSAQQDFSKITLKATKVSGNVHVLEGVGGFSGGNIGVSVGEDGILIVDDQLPPMAGKIRETLAKLHKGKLRFVLNTHWHGDHTGANVSLGKEATIVAHENARKRVKTDQKNFFGETPARPKEAWPVITFGDSLSIHFNGEEIRFLHFGRGHTDGDGVVYFTKSNVLHMGDLYFAGMFPFVDLDSGGDVLGYLENIANTLVLVPDGVKIIPGHGSLSTKEELRAWHGLLVETVEFVRKRMFSGKTLSEIKEEGLPEKFQSLGKGLLPEKAWIGFVYRSIIQDSKPSR